MMIVVSIPKAGEIGGQNIFLAAFIFVMMCV